jgi:steroid 5-alpha reductase family enzyme
MSWGALLVNLGVTALTAAVLMLGTFVYAMRTRVHAIMDTVWALGFVVIALVSFFLSAGDGVSGRRLLVLVLVVVWGVRLSAHIYPGTAGRARTSGTRRCCDATRAAWPASCCGTSTGRGGRVMWFVSLPLQVAMYEREALRAIRWLGVAVWGVGFGFETVGDWQLRRWRAVPTHAGQVLDRGLWRRWRQAPARGPGSCSARRSS